MLVDGITDVPSAAPGCEGSAAQSNAVGTADDAAVNIASGDLTLSGTKMGAADGVSVSVSSSGGGSTAPIAAAVNGNSWTATVPRAALNALGDGALTARGSFDHGGDAVGGRALALGKDTVAPTIAANRASGSYTGPVSVALSAGPGERITFRTDGQPLGVNDSVYTGPIALRNGTTTLSARSTDAAGNVTDATFTYTVTAPVAAGLTPAQLAALAALRPAASQIAPRISAPRRVSARTVRRSGLLASFVAPRGARVALVRVLRVRGSRRTLVARRVVSVRGGRRTRVRIRSTRLVPGRYLIEVRVGPSRARLGRPRTVRTVIVRR
jgi:Chitobiase/beta-hexosaminidase C-terminal domain